jgi:Fe-S cluster biogenesis protein NfuA
MSELDGLEGLPLQARLERALALCRPYLQADGGDVQLVRVRDDRVAELRFSGTCADCPLSRMTLRAGIERAMLKCAPELVRVETVSG